MPFVDKKKVLLASDFHFPHVDARAVKALLSRVDKHRDVEFDYIVLNGDVLDGEDPRREVEAMRKFAVELRKRTALQVRVVLGNHDLVAAEALGGRKALQAEFVDAFGRGTRVGDSFVEGPFTFTHGVLHRDLYAKATMRRWHITGESAFIVGHTHRAQAYHYGQAAVYGLPCMSKRGVKGAQLGYGIARLDDGIRSVEIAVVA